MDMKSTYNDLTFSNEGSSSSISLTNVFSEISSQKSSVSNQEQEDTEAISPLTTNEVNAQVIENGGDKANIFFSHYYKS